MDATGDQQKHFVLVHGACLGAWSWFKLIPLLEAAGHRVSAFDLSASGTDTKVIQQVTTLSDYTLPLLEFMATIPADEKVVLVGHSLGGMNIALAMEKFPERIAVAVFLTAFMPDSTHKPSYVLDTVIVPTPNSILDQFSPNLISPKPNHNLPDLMQVGYPYPSQKSDRVFITLHPNPPDARPTDNYGAVYQTLIQYNEKTPPEDWLDAKFLPYNNEKDSETSTLFGPKFISNKLAQLCSDEDRELLKILVRPSSLFLKDLHNAPKFTKEGFDYVQRVFVVCNEDQAIPKDFQQWMIDNNPVVEVKELKGVDHMPMLSDLKQVSVCLLDVALQYA